MSGRAVGALYSKQRGSVQANCRGGLARSCTNGPERRNLSTVPPIAAVGCPLTARRLPAPRADLKRAEGLLGSLTACLPALVIAEKLDTWQLLQMVAVSMFGHQHCARHHRGSPRTLPESGEAAADGRPEEGPAALPRERARALQLLLDFVGR